MTVVNLDCILGMRAFLADSSVDAIVCDPPYELGFMGKGWDSTGIANSVEMWREAFRVLKPGGHLLAFSGTRTYHRMACAIEDAGFDIRDQLAWVYGSGFPKSLDVSKAIDKNAGAERETGPIDPARAGRLVNQRGDYVTEAGWSAGGRSITIDPPATAAARQWEGWGTALKPAWEPICMARKPLVGTVAANVLAHGTGALNIDGCRVEGGARPLIVGRNDERKFSGDFKQGSSCEGDTTLGRWPANLMHDGSEDVLAAFPRAPGQMADASDSDTPRAGQNVYGAMRRGPSAAAARVEANKSAARFFKSIPETEDIWRDLNLPSSDAAIADATLHQLRQAVFSVLEVAVSAALPAALLSAVSLSGPPTTSATPTQLRSLSDSATQAIQTFGERFWRDPQPGRLSLSLNLVNVAAHRTPTGTTMITVDHWKSDGSAEPVTFTITPNNSEAGERDCAPSSTRFIYCAKASKADRDEGLEAFVPQPVGDGRAVAADNAYQRGKTERANTHPTVKPTDVMRWLCRLVTPPGGLVLDPFAGSGSTGKAAHLEGFQFIGFEQSAEYAAIANARIGVRR